MSEFMLSAALKTGRGAGQEGGPGAVSGGGGITHVHSLLKPRGKIADAPGAKYFLGAFGTLDQTPAPIGTDRMP